MERAVDPVLEEVAARRQDLGGERLGVVVLPVNLAEVRRLPVAEEGLEGVLVLAALDLDLEVAAARGATAPVRRPARRLGARIDTVVHREGAPGGRGHGKRPAGQAPRVDDPEPVAAELARLRRGNRRGDGPGEAMGLAADRVALHAGVPAGDVEPGTDVQLLVVPEEPPELDPLGVTEHPRRVVVGGLAQGGDPQGHVEGVAVATDGAAGRWGHEVRWVAGGRVRGAAR